MKLRRKTGENIYPSVPHPPVRRRISPGCAASPTASKSERLMEPVSSATHTIVIFFLSFVIIGSTLPVSNENAQSHKQKQTNMLETQRVLSLTLHLNHTKEKAHGEVRLERSLHFSKTINSAEIFLRPCEHSMTRIGSFFDGWLHVSKNNSKYEIKGAQLGK